MTRKAIAVCGRHRHDLGPFDEDGVTALVSAVDSGQSLLLKFPDGVWRIVPFQQIEYVDVQPEEEDHTTPTPGTSDAK